MLVTRDSVSASPTSLHIYLVGDRYNSFSKYKFKLTKLSEDEIVLSLEQLSTRCVKGYVSMNHPRNGNYTYLSFKAYHLVDAKPKKQIELQLVPFAVDIKPREWRLTNAAANVNFSKKVTNEDRLGSNAP